MTTVEYAQLDRAVGILQGVSSENNIHEVSTDFFGSVLYSRSYVIGFGWRCLWSVVDFVTQSAKSKEELALKANFQRTQSLFQSVIGAFTELHQKMHFFYQQKKFQETEMAEIRQKIDVITSAMPNLFNVAKPFLLLQTIRHVNRLYHHVLGCEGISLAQEQILRSFEAKAALCALDGILQRSCPLRPFSCLLDGHDTDGLDEWLRIIKEKEKEISPWLLHLAITAIVTLLCDEKTPEEEITHKVRLVEVELLKKGCSIFNKPDPFYKEWLHSLLPGTFLDKDVQMGELVHHRAFQKLGLSVFEKRGTNQLLVFGKSVALLGMWKVQHAVQSFFVPSVKIVKDDPYGRFVVIEKVSSSIDSLLWRSRFGGIHGEDKEKADEIARLLAYMACQKHTPTRFKARYLFFKQEEESNPLSPYGTTRLCTLLPFAKTGTHAFNRLLQVALDAAQGSHIIFRHLMHTSKLIQHPVALFYLQSVEERLFKKETKSIIDQACLQEIHDVHVVEYIRKVVEKTLELERRLYVKLVSKLFTKDDQETLKTEVAKALVTFQKDTGIAACQWHEGEKIVEEYLKSECAHLFTSPFQLRPMGALF